MKLNEYENQTLRETSNWMQSSHTGFHKKMQDMASRPVEYLVSKMGKAKLETIESSVEAILNKLLFASTYSIDTEKIIARAQAHGVMIHDISQIVGCDLELLDKCNREHIQFHGVAGAIQGAITGLGGILTGAADLSAMLVEVFHMIQEVSFCYGYDPNDVVEKEIMLRIMEIGLGGSVVKFKSLEEIGILQGVKNKTDTRQKGASMLGTRTLSEVAEHIAVRLLVTLARRALPVVSIVMGAHSNHEIVEHCGDAALMVYRYQFVTRKAAM